jgi:NDP-sugar pyrophosphorylase family protein
VILAAGTGNRARPLTKSIPKALVNVAGKTLLDRNLQELSRAGIRDITVAIGYRAAMIEGYLTSHGLMSRSESRVTTVPVPDYKIGPLRTTLTAIESFSDDEFLITPVDAVVSSSILSNMLNQYSEAPAKMLLAVDFTAESGTPVYVNNNGLIVGIGDSVPGGEFSVGRSVMLLIADRTIEEYCRSALLKGESHLVPVLNQMIRDGAEVVCSDVQTQWYDIDTLSDVLTANSLLLRTADVQDFGSGIFIPLGDIMETDDRLTMKDSNIVVSEDVTLQGPVLLSPGSRIEERCRIGPDVTICPSARISNGCELINTIVHDSSRVPPNSRIENAIVYGRQIYKVEL